MAWEFRAQTHCSCRLVIPANSKKYNLMNGVHIKSNNFNLEELLTLCNEPWPEKSGFLISFCFRLLILCISSFQHQCMEQGKMQKVFDSQQMIYKLDMMHWTLNGRVYCMVVLENMGSMIIIQVLEIHCWSACRVNHTVNVSQSTRGTHETDA